MPVRRRMLDLDIKLVLGLGVRLGLMSDLGARLGYRCGFSVVGRRPVGGVQSDIWVWGWGLGI